MSLLLGQGRARVSEWDWIVGAVGARGVDATGGKG